ncbi:putative Protein tyrosine kinase [Blattamonas nauphoetae]|uniref:Protein kinase domain-containing protein n=1 Tax=Blattamonas nauphoetae TaxID=2049346 RepID=A0ABQ9YCB0_9EUKA|nr:putative Protein tyrosine kinase [Blattamonas nauphoetae]
MSYPLPDHLSFVQTIAKRPSTQVILVKSSKTTLTYAAKLLTASPGINIDAIKKNALVLRSLSHPSVLRVEGIYTIKQTTVIASDFYEQKSLLEYLSLQRQKKIPVPLEDAYQISLEICKGLAYLSDKQLATIINLKTVLINSAIHACITRVFSPPDIKDYSQTSTHLLSRRFMSPEQIQNPNTYFPTSSIWSLGCLLFEFITGDHLFPQQTQSDLDTAICRFSPESIKMKVPSNVYSVLSLCLLQNPSDRSPAQSLIDNKILDHLISDPVVRARYFERKSIELAEKVHQQSLKIVQKDKLIRAKNRIIQEQKSEIQEQRTKVDTLLAEWQTPPISPHRTPCVSQQPSPQPSPTPFPTPTTSPSLDQRRSMLKYPVLLTEMFTYYEKNSFEFRTESVKRSGGDEWRSFCSFPITSGIWRIGFSPKVMDQNICVGIIAFSKARASLKTCIGRLSGGAHFGFWYGSLMQNNNWIERQNEIIERVSIGQTAFMELNMGSRTLHLFVENRQQAHYFCEVPDRVSVAVSMSGEGDEIGVSEFGEIELPTTSTLGQGHPIDQG